MGTQFIIRYLRNLFDVDTTGAVPGDNLTYNGTLWVPGAGGGGGGAPTTADYLVGTANASLTNEIVVGPTPGGELGGTWASPTVPGAVITAPASSARNVILPQNGNTIAAIIKSHADWQTGAASGDMLDFQDENGVLIGGFYRNQATAEPAFFAYADPASLGAIFLTAGGIYMSILTGATRSPIWIQTQGGSDLFRVLPSGSLVITPDDYTIPSQLIRARTPGINTGQGILELRDTQDRQRIWYQIYELEDPNALESDTYIYFSSGEGQAANTPSVIDFNFLREGDSSGNKVAFALDMICNSSTDGYLGMQRYISGQGGIPRPVRVDWATGNLQLGGNGGVNIRDVNHAVTVGPTSVAASIPLTIQARADQTGDLLALVDINAAVLSRVNKAGYYMTRKITVPADGDLVASELTEWFDPTNGAAKVMRKGKTADGTVVTWEFPSGVYSPGGGAPTTATYITQTPDAGLSAEQALSALATGLVKNTTGTGVLSIGAQGTDYYAPGGTDVALADGGTGASLVDPGADRIMFWDDSAGATAFLTPGTNLTITGTTLDATGGGGAGAHENGQAGVLAPTCGGWFFNPTPFIANRCLLARFMPTSDLAVTMMAFFLHVAGAAGNQIDVGIYSADLSTRLGSSGSIVPTPDMSSISTKELALTATVNLVAGTVYYAAIVPNTTAGQMAGAMINNMGTAGTESLFGSAIGKFETGIKDLGSGVLPASIATPTPSSYQGPALAVRES